MSPSAAGHAIAAWLRLLLSSIIDLHRRGISMLWVAPLVLALVIVPEFLQHVAEIRLGMFNSREAAVAVANHPTRMAFGYAQIAGLVLTFLAAARYPRDVMRFCCGFTRRKGIDAMTPMFKFGAAAALMIAAPAIAHHGWSSYDNSKTIRVTAPLSAVTWGNPHGTAKVMWQRKQWDVILAPTMRMEARGLSRGMLTSRRPVTLIGYPRRDGAAEMRIETVLAGGRRVELR